eukprot:gnl/TRDRNA2_/TRDRNA2_175846_c0_seq1.p1 gnl/TRDRNA2_/TRDRNA2_175846_c0~~gnl/TRDRNA2_/TRDRNA2_175846_c0_seq1.p1  ORF type:complete len:124 (+),score=1.92 gnl/TRDRNA2_/TRDRNA2_175846_c0_seq1:364-735(+)
MHSRSRECLPSLTLSPLHSPPDCRDLELVALRSCTARNTSWQIKHAAKRLIATVNCHPDTVGHEQLLVQRSEIVLLLFEQEFTRTLVAFDEDIVLQVAVAFSCLLAIYELGRHNAAGHHITAV